MLINDEIFSAKYNKELLEVFPKVKFGWINNSDVLVTFKLYYPQQASEISDENMKATITSFLKKVVDFKSDDLQLIKNSRGRYFHYFAKYQRPIVEEILKFCLENGVIEKVNEKDLFKCLILNRTPINYVINSSATEGNTITNDVELQARKKEDEERIDIINQFNLLINIAKKEDWINLREDDILNFHKILYKNVLNTTRFGNECGKFKTEPNYTTNGYLPCAPLEIKNEMKIWLKYYNQKPVTIHEAFVHALISHLWFESIHPFSDGNGRLGRILFSFYFKLHGFTENCATFDLTLELSGQVYKKIVAESQKYNDYIRFIEYCISLIDKQETNKFIANPWLFLNI